MDQEDFMGIRTGEPLELEVAPGRYVLGFAYSNAVKDEILFKASILAASGLGRLFPNGNVSYRTRYNLYRLDEVRHKRYQGYLQAIFEALKPVFIYVCSLYQAHAYIGTRKELTPVEWRLVLLYTTPHTSPSTSAYVYLRNDGAWLRKTHFDTALHDEYGKGERAAMILGTYPYQELVRSALTLVLETMQINPQALDQLREAEKALQGLLHRQPHRILSIRKPR
ncbi:MAG: hypothetical protein A3F33_02865 [Candidatus Woykebacteria bacterium RIFCSPHIGHO2_12_FULL_43_10]|uniref:Uncharacterized protein n=2 Tax=Candidatus Woykeibacteriota TaxID=1817899 RepID=A0A1G1WYN6_9BACT|nr:MAG: hypothetical protein A2802_01490 [Candidatus Woykebacteria bacterium RIFCSPHIGHO2_01_FULL_43_29]OGY28690.1 MAG: hypothetical protein A3J50_01070 [Candidatus Woykebacteria bacterium RIFCSPHIGHO2_02_FULL_43_16b]OGY29765.1 MAG: hypothetical protein A3F33_02865 [Candidatus Woykebacteria bacterium RIFCSPHIGHO2_12_FULL_43_10]OGY32440.1 MAG: hypothetical protein A3A61_00595 [Candidatus Woykebacteria bacterium RIFCSPLOWO2_01_FULL_43_14]